MALVIPHPPRTQPEEGPRPTGHLSPKSPRYESLDFWRGAACLLVLIFHSTMYVATAENESQLNQGGVDRWAAAVTARLWIGVPMFFVISGYCISATADSSRRKNSSALQYFVRRFKRIYPPYWIFLAVFGALVGFVELLALPGLFTDDHHPIRPLWGITLPHFLCNLTLTETWLPRLWRGGTSFSFGHAWTLCYEEQFYAVVGATLFFTRRHFFRMMTAITLFVLFLCLSFDTVRLRGFFFDGHWLHFAAGVLLYYQINYASRQQKAFLGVILLLGVLWAASEPARLIAFKGNAQQEHLVAFSFALLLSLLHRHDPIIARARALWPITLCGTMCYSLYLVHWPIVKAVSHGSYLLGVTKIWPTLLVVVPACIASSLVVGWVFHIRVEKHFLNINTNQENKIEQNESERLFSELPG